MLNVITQILKRLPYFIVLIFVTGCVSALPMKHKYKSHENFSVPFNEIWKLSNNIIEERVSAIDVVDIKSGFLKTEEFNVPYEGFQYQSKYADCGKLGGLYVYHRIIGYYEIFISESEDNRTVVSTIPHYRASLWLGNSFKGWVPCQSKGYVEQLLLDDLRAKIQKSHPKEALIPQPENGVDKESDSKSTPHILKTQDNDNKRTVKPEINLISETELRKLRIKYEKVLRENEKLKNEIALLKRNNNFETNEKNPGEAKLSNTESPPELTIKSDNDVTTKSLLNKVNKEHSLVAKPLSQGKDDSLQIYTIQAGSFLKIDRARAHIDFMTDLLQTKDYGNLRIEKIGDLYTVRLGKFENYQTAKKFLQEMKPRLSDAIILKANIINKRIIRLHE